MMQRIGGCKWKIMNTSWETVIPIFQDFGMVWKRPHLVRIKVVFPCFGVCLEEDLGKKMYFRHLLPDCQFKLGKTAHVATWRFTKGYFLLAAREEILLDSWRINPESAKTCGFGKQGIHRSHHSWKFFKANPTMNVKMGSRSHRLLSLFRALFLKFEKHGSSLQIYFICVKSRLYIMAKRLRGPTRKQTPQRSCVALNTTWHTQYCS